MNKKIGLLFGSFNPVHVGHMIIAQYMLNQTDLAEVWFIVSPQNPLKSQKDLYPEVERLKMVELAINKHPKMKASDIEFDMPKPSYTFNTLKVLKEKYPDKEFVIIMGSDNLLHFDKWKEPELIIKNHDIYVYQREGNLGGDYAKNHKVKVYKAPMLNIAATAIRGLLRMKKDVRFYVPDTVYKYLIALEESGV